MFFIALQSCSYEYQSKVNPDLKIQIANQDIDFNELDKNGKEAIQFSAFTNGSLVDFKENTKSTVFKITQTPQQINNKELKTLMVMPHYFSEVMLLDSQLRKLDLYKRNVYNHERQYSPNITAFDLSSDNQVYYVLIKNRISKKIQFIIENRNNVKNYDQKLLITFTTVYSIILTLIFVNLVFFIFIKQKSYLYYSLFIAGTLFALFFQEGLIAYFPTLSQPVFGSYTRIIWLKLPAIFFWLFTISFLNLKNKSRIDYNLARLFLYIEILVNVLILFLSLFDITGIYPYIANFINLITFVGVLIAIYIPIKYAILKVPQAIYLAIGLTVYLLTIAMRIYYSINMDPMAFWLPRAFEFGLMFEAVVLSIGLADKTMRIMKQRDAAEHNFLRVDRELFCRELENSFYKRSTETIEKYFGTKTQLNRIIDSYFIASLQQLVVVKDVFYVYEYKNKIGIKHISAPVVDFNIENYVDNNRVFLNRVCAENKACYQLYNISQENKLPFIVIPIKKKKHDNLCLFLTLPSYIEINEDLIQDLYIFANTMTHSLLSIRKFQKTIEDSRTDALTNVFNRKTMDLKLQRLITLAYSDNLSIAMAFIDLDDFKYVNDKHGHDVGDECLVFLCNKLKEVFTVDTFVGRYGGDEFIVLFRNHNQTAIEEKMNQIYEYFQQYSIHDIKIKISIGIAIATKENDLLDSKKLLKAADSALYSSKQDGKNQYTFY